MKINPTKALELLANPGTPQTVKNTLSHWLANYAGDVPAYVALLNSVMEDVPTCRMATRNEEDGYEDGRCRQ